MEWPAHLPIVGVGVCHGPSINSIEIEESPNPTTQHLFYMLKASKQEVWNGNPDGHSQLSAVSRLLNIKAEHHIS